MSGYLQLQYLHVSVPSSDLYLELTSCIFPDIFNIVRNSSCRKKRGCQPTGLLINTSMATGSSSVSEVLSKGGEQSNGEHATLDTVNLPTMATAPVKLHNVLHLL